MSNVIEHKDDMFNYTYICLMSYTYYNYDSL